MTTMTQFAPALPSRSGWLAATLAALSEAWGRYRLYEQTYNELTALSDRELTDLGIARGAIPGIAHEAAYGQAD